MKKKIKKLIFEKNYNGIQYVTYKDIPTNLEPDDIIEIYQPEEYDKNNLEDTVLLVYRYTEETDEEYNKRILAMENYNKIMEKQRYQHFLLLQKKYENYTIPE